MNTRMIYLYRDADNYKTWNEVILAGEITGTQVARITQSLAFDSTFIPERVGLRARRWEEGNGYDEDSDLALCELVENAFEFTDSEATEPITTEELALRFEALSGKWFMTISFPWEEIISEEIAI